jgi:hypothetical protein
MDKYWFNFDCNTLGWNTAKYYQANDPDYNGRGFYFGKIVQKARCHAVPKAFSLSKNTIHTTVKLRSHGPQGSSTDMYKTKLACIKQLLCAFGLFLKLLKYFAHLGQEAKWM